MTKRFLLITLALVAIAGLSACATQAKPHHSGGGACCH